MKTKYLLTAAAIASLFAACSQEEIFNPSTVEADLTKGRQMVAGEVVFNSADPATRYNSESATVEDKDEFGVYLMDEFRGYNYGNEVGELDNANTTWWKYQSNWWQMYELTDNIQTNYGYVYDASKGVWENSAAQLCEGNYFIMFPKNDEATNRRDLWQYINPVVELAKHSDASKGNYFVNRENQFFVDYAQIYRDDNPSVDGKFQLNVKLRAVLTYLKIVGWNQSATKFRAKKIVFKAPEGAPLPTIAYIKPAWQVNEQDDSAYWVNDDEEAAEETVKDECGNVLGKGLYNPETFTQRVARSLVQYEAPIDRIPYGLKENQQAVAYEYTFNFPGDNGLELDGNTTENNNCTFTASIALPAFDLGDYDFKDLEVVIYGEMYDKGIQEWRSGLLKYQKFGQGSNQVFTLNDLDLWEKGYEIPTVQVYFDDQSFVQGEEIRVETTEDLITLLKARLSKATTTKNIHFEVYPYGKGLAITDEVVKIITDYEDKNNKTVSVTFKSALTQGETPVILKAQDCINMFRYKGVNVICNADQTSTEELRNISTLTNNAVMVINAAYNGTKIVNAGALTVNAEVTAKIHNDNVLVLKASSVTGDIENAQAMTVSGTSVVSGTITNDNNCVSCGKTPAVLTIEEAGSLKVTKLINTENDEVIVNGALVADEVENTGAIFDISAASKIGTLTNGAAINIAKGTTTLLSDNSVNDGAITIAEGAELLAGNDAQLQNNGTINVAGHLWNKIKNDGVINVIENGHVITDGYTEKAGIIDVTKATNSDGSNSAKDSSSRDTYFRYTVAGEETASALEGKLADIISEENYGRNPVILCWDENSAAKFQGTVDRANVTTISISRDLTFNGKTQFSDLTAQNANAFVVAKGTTTIANGASLALGKLYRVNHLTYRWTKIDVTINAAFHVNNGGETIGGGDFWNIHNGDNVTVSGTGIVTSQAANGKFQWVKGDGFTGNWWN